MGDADVCLLFTQLPEQAGNQVIRQQRRIAGHRDDEFRPRCFDTTQHTGQRSLETLPAVRNNGMAVGGIAFPVPVRIDDDRVNLRG